MALVLIPVMLHGCRSSSATYTGSLFTSDAGRSHGRFEYTATWTAELKVTGGSGGLTLSLETGLGDALTKHDYAVTDFASTAAQLTMKLAGQPLVLPLVQRDAVWNGQFDGYYIASWGSDAPTDEIRGTISPVYLPGLGSLYYVELRLKMVKPSPS